METDQHIEGITIRRLGSEDAEAIERLAELDSSRTPKGQLLGAEIEGRLLVAVAIGSGESIADPFVRTAELRTLLEIRAAQMRGADRSRWSLRRRGRTRGAPAGSSSGAGGKLLTLPRVS